MSAPVTFYGLPILFALFVWWFSTGAIFFLDTRPAHTFRWSLAVVTALAAGAVWGVMATSGQTSLSDAYAGFTYGLIVWGWLETAFYMGYMVGPRRRAPAVRGSGWAHFAQAVGTTLYHEVAAIALAAVLAAICWDMPNKLALWTFLLLWLMQLSAKLNVFLGVPNLAEEFLPQHLAFLRHYMTRKPMNPAFPLSVTVATVVATMFAAVAATATTGYGAASSAMLASLAALAVLELWLLVVPLRLDVLWRWALSRGPRSVPARREGERLVAPVSGKTAGQPSAPSSFVAEPAFINPVVS